MDSDKKSIQEQGGGEPKPYSPGQSGGNQQSNQPNTPSQPGQGGGGQPPQNLPSQGGGNAPSPSSPSTPGGGQPVQGGGGSQFPPVGGDQNKQDQGGSFPPKQVGGGSGGGQEPPKEMDGGEVKPLGPEKPAGKNNKKLFVVLLSVIIIIGILVAAYFFILPIFTGGGDEAPEADQPAATETQEEQQEDEFEVPTVPSEGEEATSTDEGESTTTAEEETATTTGPEGEEEVVGSEEIAVDSHVSAFSSPVDSTVEKTLSTMDLSGLVTALEISSTEVPLFREVVLNDGEENVIRTEEVMPIIAPSVFTESVLDSFESDPTLFTYTDDGGTWFGLALNAKASADLASVKNQVAELENNTSEVKSFFLSDPGDATSWKDGGAGDVTSRYLTFSNEGASFNYGWSGNTLLISTSYTGFQEAVNNL